MKLFCTDGPSLVWSGSCSWKNRDKESEEVSVCLQEALRSGFPGFWAPWAPELLGSWSHRGVHDDT